MEKFGRSVGGDISRSESEGKGESGFDFLTSYYFDEEVMLSREMKQTFYIHNYHNPR